MKRALPYLLAGFSIVEFSVAMAISLIIMAAVSQIFVSSRMSYGAQEGLARVQENGRFAMDFIARDIRMAGYTGCTDLSPSKINDTVSGGSGFTTTKYISGYTYTGSGGAAASDWTPSLPSALGALPYTDVITVVGAAGDSFHVALPVMPTVSAALHVANNNGLQQGDIVMVSDCSQADIFQLTNANPDTTGTLVHNTGAGVPGNSTSNLSKAYQADADVYKLNVRTYYIKNGAGGGPSLFRKDGSASEELVEGVESIKFLYGEDTNHDRTADVYNWSDDITAWANVVSVEVGVVVKTTEQVESQLDKTTFDVLRLADASGDAKSLRDNFTAKNDKARRRLFTTTVQLRNSGRY